MRMNKTTVENKPKLLFLRSEMFSYQKEYCVIKDMQNIKKTVPFPFVPQKKVIALSVTQLFNFLKQFR